MKIMVIPDFQDQGENLPVTQVISSTDDSAEIVKRLGTLTKEYSLIFSAEDKTNVGYFCESEREEETLDHEQQKRAIKNFILSQSAPSKATDSNESQASPSNKEPDPDVTVMEEHPKQKPLSRSASFKKDSLALNIFSVKTDVILNFLKTNKETDKYTEHSVPLPRKRTIYSSDLFAKEQRKPQPTIPTKNPCCPLF